MGKNRQAFSVTSCNRSFNEDVVSLTAVSQSQILFLSLDGDSLPNFVIRVSPSTFCCRFGTIRKMSENDLDSRRDWDKLKARKMPIKIRL